MDREQAREFMVNHPEQYLEPMQGGYVCPICQSIGNHGHKDNPITTKDGIHFTCWRECFQNSDIIDIIGVQYGLDAYGDKLRKAAELYGIEISENQNYTKIEQKQKPTAPAKQMPLKEETNYSQFFIEAHRNIDKTDYWSRRGLTKATIDHFNIGYVEEWQSPAALKRGSNSLKSPRLIIPTSDYSYIARDTRAKLDERQKKFAKLKEGKVHIFNIGVLRTATKPVFIVEGEIDAMSIYEAGGLAVGLGGVSNIRKFAEEAAEIPQAQPYIIALDNDKSGEKKSEELLKLLKEQNIKCCELEVQGKYKDANEALMADREMLASRITQAEEIASLDSDAAERYVYEQKMQAADYIETMRQELETELALPEISSGFPKLDTIINGGLYPGLYFIGAVSSLGKTTFALQIADEMAKQGQDVLIVSLEMAKRELIAKSISRITAEYAFENSKNTLARSTTDILNLKRQARYSASQKAAIDIAYQKYKSYAEHIFIYEGIGDITPESIRQKAEMHRLIYGKAPAIIVDYLQILQADDARLSDKQKTDKSVVELKRISRDYKTPVIVVSSVNRSSYDEPIGMESFKESGGIEFSSDILIGLQYYGYDYIDGEAEQKRRKRLSELKKAQYDKAKKGEPQSIELKILKNRNGSRGSMLLDFYPMFNYYKESVIDPERQNEEEKKLPRRI